MFQDYDLLYDLFGPKEVKILLSAFWPLIQLKLDFIMFQDQDENNYLFGNDDYDCWCSNTCSIPPISTGACDIVFDDCSPVTCQCGNATFALVTSLAVNQRCCVPSTCESPGVCPQGHVIPISEYCENQDIPSVRCYNSYQESDTISEQSHFACSDNCVPVLDMCQGIDWCTEVNECNEDLRCPPGTSKQVPRTNPITFTAMETSK